jgi:hypothetical protein
VTSPLTTSLPATTGFVPVIVPATKPVVAPAPVNAPPPGSWSIGLLYGSRLGDLGPVEGIPNPIFTAADVTDRRAAFLADPFVHYVDGMWHLFVEMFDEERRKGVIAAARSKNLREWEYLGVVLEEPHHLSYPFVFEHDGDIYMVPESRSARQVNIYRATRFPFEWKVEKTLLRGKLFDASFVQYEGRFWMLVGWWSYWMKAFHAPHPLGPWTAHSWPVVRTYAPGLARPGGRPVMMDGKLVRFGQDNRQHYGHQLNAFEVTALTPHWYAERLLSPSPLLQPTGNGWNAKSMHHIDLQRHPNGGWLAFVDGSS